MANQKIQEYNEKLVENNINIGIVEYVKNLNGHFYNINIDFIDDFIDMVDKDECCIPHEYLTKYGVTQMTGGSSDVKRILISHSSVEGKDHIVQVSTNAEKKEKITYILHPIIFKKILIRSRNTDIFADYYLLLEMCIKYYNDYQNMLLKKKIEEDNKIKLLLLNETETLDNFTIFRCDEDTLFVRKNPHNKGYIITKHDYDEYPYVMINGSNKNVTKILNACKIKHENMILKIRCPSHLNFVRKIKEVLGDKFERMSADYEDELDSNATRTSNTRFFKLNGIAEEKFIDAIEKLHSSRGSIF